VTSTLRPRVALVFPYFRTRAPTEMLFPPLGLAALLAQLRRRGIDAKVFDCTFGAFERLRADLRAYRPAIIGISSMVSLTRNALRVVEMARADFPGCLIVAGGPLPTVFPGRYAGHVDAVLRGESDLSFPQFCADYFGVGASPSDLGSLELDTYAGLFVQADGLHVDNPAVHHSESELAGFPLPDRNGFDHAAYQREWMRLTGRKVTSLLATLGCPYSCDFCSRPVFGNIVRHRDLDAVFAEIDQIRELGYDSLWIADDTFTMNEAYLEAFCRRIAPLGITWTCLSRAHGIGLETMRLMKAAGCHRVYLGLESGNQATLDLMKKQITVEQGVGTTSLYREAGIDVAAFFIVGYPGETVASIEDTFSIALSLPLDEISFNVPIPLPGSTLFERLGGPDDGRDWAQENEVTFLFPSEIDEAWLRRRIDETMAAFARKK
jgi:radical SAM superfamily enzyme YgiQ (UPF0313 family)